MKRLAVAFFSITLLAIAAIAQGSSVPGPQTTSTKKAFRATKNQIKEAQTKLKASNLYAGDATGKLDGATRASVKEWQGGNGLKRTGTLNRATLEKMGIELTESQKLIPVTESSYATADNKSPGQKDAGSPAKPKKTVFRATKDQIVEAQKKLKAGNTYSGEETGKLDPATREGLKKYQEANGLKVTGTLNQVTLEKMGIELTDKQKGSSAAPMK